MTDTKAQPGRGWKSLYRDFYDSFLDASPLEPWVAGVRKIGPWQWGTRTFDAMEHYMFRDDFIESLVGEPALTPRFMISHAGHGINYSNIRLIRKVPHLSDLNIGHSIVSRAVFVGLEAAVREMIFMMSAME